MSLRVPTQYGFLGGGSRDQGPRGPAGTGVSSIDTVDNSDGTVSLTFNLSDGSEIITSNNLVSDTLIALDEIELSGTNKSHKLSVENNTGTQLLLADTIADTVFINPTLSVKTGLKFIEVKSDKVTFGNLSYETPASLNTSAEGVISVTGRLSQTSAPISDTHLTNKVYVDGEIDTVQALIENVTITAQDANSTANTANSTANTAISTANTANSTANTAISYLNQNVKTVSSPEFVSLQFPSSQTTPTLVSGKMVLATNDGGDLIIILPTGITVPIVGATMPFKRLLDSVTSVIYTEPSANLFSIIWDSTSLSAAISFPGSTYYGSTSVNVASSLVRSSTISTSENTTSSGIITIIPGTTFFLLTRSTTAPAGGNQMSSSGMHFWAEVFTRNGGDENGPYPVFRIEIRKGIADGSSFNVKWLY